MVALMLVLRLSSSVRNVLWLNYVKPFSHLIRICRYLQLIADADISN